MRGTRTETRRSEIKNNGQRTDREKRGQVQSAKKAKEKLGARGRGKPTLHIMAEGRGALRRWLMALPGL